MTSRQPLPSRPVADPRAVVVGPTYRISVLTDGLVRLEHSADGVFEDRASTFALHRDLPVPDFRVIETETHVEVRHRPVPPRLRPPPVQHQRPERLGAAAASARTTRCGGTARSRPGLGGTARTLDLADGAIPLEPGVVSRQGFAVLDDSRSMVFDDEGWVSPRDGSRTDLYVFAYGHDYRAAVQAFYAVSGPTPLLPRFALGNWWSRFHRYTADSYAALLDRFDAEGIPFSVAVIDMDWHVTDVDPALGSGWTGYTWNRSLFPDPAAFLAVACTSAGCA